MKNQFVILFDFDGVLIESVDFAGEVASKYRIQKAGLSQFFKMHLQKCLTGNGDLLKLLAENQKAIGWSGSANDLFNALYVETQKYNATLLKFIRSTNHQDEMYIATNQDINRHQLICNDKILKPYIKGVFSSCQLGVAKPNIVYFQKIYNIFNQ